MDFDVEGHLGAVERAVRSLERDGRAARAVTLSRRYAATVEELWDAVTNGERIPKWFLPVSGDLREGGRYQLEGNAGGVITACERPSRLALTWEYGGSVGWVDALLGDDGADGPRLILTHTQHLSDHWTEYGPAAVGIGWEMGLVGLALHLARPEAPKLDEAAFAASRAGKAFMARSGEGWGEAAAESGEDPEAARAAARRTVAFYTGEVG